jgi:hypothetical protein
VVRFLKRVTQERRSSWRSSEEVVELRKMFKEGGFPLREGIEVQQELTELREIFEPFNCSLSRYFRLKVPHWLPRVAHRDNWQTSAWERRGGGKKEVTPEDDEHF